MSWRIRKRTRLFLFISSLAAASSAASPHEVEAAQAAKRGFGQKAPLLTTDVVYDTANFFHAVYSRFLSDHIEEHRLIFLTAIDPLISALPEDPVTELCSAVGCKKEELEVMCSQVKESIVKVGELLKDKTALAEERLMHLVDLFEEAMPQHRGLISRSIGDASLTMLYFGAVCYGLARALLCTLQWAASVLCCMCCCRCSRKADALEEDSFRQEEPMLRRPPWLPAEADPLPPRLPSRYDHVSSSPQVEYDRTPECCIFPNLNLFG
eukprot:TRINITY_DN96673_c0_g1_i1.p1 TRINITY_DN96673_c0_g1~~TRINITY_DN96673_c0_g1_i1.p1  ORF type:complete len:280 (-),score=60.00 TRINITY_DN96673_c0_g1_i1:17-817(-)